MRKLKVRRQPLPGTGELFQLDTRTVVGLRFGRHDIASGRGDEKQPLVTAGRARAEALAVATPLSGAHREKAATPRS